MPHLTETQIASGKELIEAAERKGIHITAAFWFYFDNGESWKLVLSTKKIVQDGPRETYEKIQKVLKSSSTITLTLSEISLLKPKAPLLVLMRSVIKTGPGISGIRFTGNVVNSQLIPDAYVYRIL